MSEKQTKSCQSKTIPCDALRILIIHTHTHTHSMHQWKIKSGMKLFFTYRRIRVHVNYAKKKIIIIIQKQQTINLFVENDILFQMRTFNELMTLNKKIFVSFVTTFSSSISTDNSTSCTILTPFVHSFIHSVIACMESTE